MTAAPAHIPLEDTVPHPQELDELRAMLPDVQAEEQELDRKSRMWEHVMRVLPVAVVVVGDVHVHETSRAFDRLLGYQAGDLAGQPWLDLVHPDDQQRAVQAALRTSAAGAVTFQCRARMHDGRYRMLEWRQYLAPEDGVTVSIVSDGGETDR